MVEFREHNTRVVHQLEVQLPEGATDQLIMAICDAIDSWHTSCNGGDWYDLTETTESIVYCEYLTDDQMRDLIGEIKAALKFI